MCYEKEFFRRLVSKKVQRLEETKPVERTPATTEPVRLKPAPQTKRAKETELEVV